MRKDKLKSLHPAAPSTGLPPAEPETGAGDTPVNEAPNGLADERYRTFVEDLQEGVYELDRDGNFTYFNHAMCQLFGTSEAVLRRRNFAGFVDAESVRRTHRVLKQIDKTGQGVVDLLWRLDPKKVSERYLEVSVHPIRIGQRIPVGYRGVARDVSERYKAHEQLRKSEIRQRARLDLLQQFGLTKLFGQQAEMRYRTLLDFVPYPIAVFNENDTVSYVNAAFTETFGWALAEIGGKRLPFIPEEREAEDLVFKERLRDEKVVLFYETQRLTRDGRLLDVIMRATVYAENETGMRGTLFLMRDVTQEKKITRTQDALLRISLALPEQRGLEGLLHYISSEIKTLLGVEGALVILLDEAKNEFFFMSGAHDDADAERRVKEVRYPVTKGVAGEVLRTGQPIIVHDYYKDPNAYTMVDDQAGFKSRNMLDVPLRSRDRIIGVLCALSKKEGSFDQTDVELLSMIAGTVELSIENARYSKELQEAYEEVKSLNRAKDKVINRLSHELKTPVSVLSASLNILAKRLSAVPPERWMPTIERAKRNLNRILEIQYQVEDIIRDRHYDTHFTLNWLLDECADELETLVAETQGEGEAVGAIRRRIAEIFGQQDAPSQEIQLERFVQQILSEIRPDFRHREVTILEQLEPAPPIWIPPDALRKVIVGLVRNAVENTPDEGRIEIFVRPRGSGAELVVRDYGVGITPENQKRIFEGFFSTQETLDYSSKRPYDFMAGGKGADLLRMKIFSERYHFRIEMSSVRCDNLPVDKSICPGRISRCDFCRYDATNCHKAAGTTFTVYFPEARKERQRSQE